MKAGPRQNAIASKARKATADAQKPAELEEQEQKQLDRMELRHLLRKKYLGTPDGLEGQSAETYVEAQLTKMLVPAVDEVRFRLKTGNDDQRYQAAKDVLAAKGYGPKEAGNGNVSPILILRPTEGGVLIAPWDMATGKTLPNAPKVHSSLPVDIVDGEVVSK